MDGMKQRWLSSSLAELDRVYQYISQENPKVAKRVFTRIRRATKSLKSFPEAGRVGHIQGTRELPVAGLPYLIVYQVNEDTVEILRVIHTSMDWPAGTMQ